jgi:hypothetical protein
MLAKLRARLTYANVVATLALFLALGGVSYGALRVGSATIVNNSIRTQDLRNNEVRSRDIRNRTIIGRDVLTNTITGLQVRESSLAKVPDADTLDGQESATFRVRCPSGTVAHAGACFEQGSRTAQTFAAASRTCGAENRRLPLFSELESLRQEPGITLADGTDPELTANAYGSGPLILGIDDDGDETTLSANATERFRCVAPLSNQ